MMMMIKKVEIKVTMVLKAIVMVIDDNDARLTRRRGISLGWR